MIVIDTGPVVAAANRKDDYHKQCVEPAPGIPRSAPATSAAHHRDRVHAAESGTVKMHTVAFAGGGAVPGYAGPALVAGTGVSRWNLQWVRHLSGW